MRKLTDAQRDFLNWLATQPNHTSEWTRNGKRTMRGPKHWTHMKVSGPTSSWLIEKGQLDGIRGLYGPAEFGSRNLYALTDAGRAALAEQEKGDA
ncbi:hypothetical protein LPC10_01955 [Methylorubrum sp. B1-46]|uniref:hypothetical protein n=1 Tax=Methylorubrum sp. B1-46 TaxID=2897334 RepID=UPI001E4E7B17|nr:hypothetical protein [Methylorubrum sp. B1-46]UGB26405.1 hypothetical protein LPC10_01955 [Methylorubrum sp. B1-46]